MARPRRAAVALALLIAALLSTYSVWFLTVRNPRVLAPAGAVLRLTGDRPWVTFTFGAHGWTSHVTGAWRSDAPAWVNFCPTGERCAYVLPDQFAGYCGQTINISLAGKPYDLTIVAWNRGSANITITAALVVTFAVESPAQEEGPAPGNSVEWCGAAA